MHTKLPFQDLCAVVAAAAQSNFLKIGSANQISNGQKEALLGKSFPWPFSKITHWGQGKLSGGSMIPMSPLDSLN